jgi:hypothetical protein
MSDSEIHNAHTDDLLAANEVHNTGHTSNAKLSSVLSAILSPIIYGSVNTDLNPEPRRASDKATCAKVIVR